MKEKYYRIVPIKQVKGNRHGAKLLLSDALIYLSGILVLKPSARAHIRLPFTEKQAKNILFKDSITSMK